MRILGIERPWGLSELNVLSDVVERWLACVIRLPIEGASAGVLGA